MDWKNKLYYGDNLDVLREHIPDESVDLVYIDPPFNSKATYNVLFQEKNGAAPAAQVKAFEDSWQWDIKAEETYHEVVTHGPKKLADLLQAFRVFLGTNDMMAYLTMMSIRLIELHRVLKPTGSIYLHCDPTASHYIKLVLDAIFGASNFRNEIIWLRTTPKSHITRRFPNTHDVIYFYGKSEESKFNMVYLPHNEDYIKNFYKYIDPDTGRRYRLDNLTNPNKNRPNLTYEFKGVTRVWRWTKERMEKADQDGRIVSSPGKVPSYKRYLDEMPGTPATSVWTDILNIQSQANERLGFPTQKPETLLERIIRASSNVGDLVLDAFCGCGTTVAVAERLRRRWIGIDITHLAIALMKYRLENTFEKDLSPYETIGIPQDLKSAEALAEQDKYQFEWWALSLVEARPAGDKKKGADKGIDGYIYFFDDHSGQTKKVIIQVKGGHVTASQIRDLKGVLEREKAQIGAFITLQEPTKPMREEAAAAGFYEPEIYLGKKKYPRLQILTINELLNGKQLEFPRLQLDTFKKAERKSKEEAVQTELF